MTDGHKWPTLGAIPALNMPRNPPTVGNYDRQEILQRSRGEDHTVTNRHRLSLRHYPKDCPPLRVRWFYAVDFPKWKPSLPDNKVEESKPRTVPKKFVPFTSKDSQAIESAFQKLSDLEAEREESKPSKSPENQGKPGKVPVNEDYLFDVDVERRELSPAYWLGPVYEVRRGTWFFQDGSTITPCEENLATQLEEGYLKNRPWVSRDNLDTTSTPPDVETDPKPTRNLADSPIIGQSASRSFSGAHTYRLFGAYMNSTATYQDSSTVLLTTDDFMSRVSTTVYQKLGGVPGTKIVRGFSETKRQKEMNDERVSWQRPDKQPRSEGKEGDPPLRADKHVSRDLKDDESLVKSSNDDIVQRSPMSALERQMSSLAGEPHITADLEEEARRQEEKEMEDLRETNGEDREREIDHLVLVTHGIGQRLGLRLESINFIHDVNVLRKTMKSVYKASPDLQAFNSDFADKSINCRVQVLPVCWRHLLDFPYQGVRQNRRELDLADADIEDELYPSLADITLDSVPAVRNLISDLAMDVLLYQSAYCDHISRIVKEECNRVIRLFVERNPSFRGSVSLCGHSLGSAILFDILCHETSAPNTFERKNNSEKSDTQKKAPDQRLNFECEELFCLGSPIALFQMLKGKTISGRSYSQCGTSEGFFASKEQPGLDDPVHTISQNNSIVSSPKCRQLYNIFHPSDPVSYRLEPLISPAMSSLKPQPLPSVKKSLWAASGQSLSIIGSRVGQSVGSLWTNLTSGVASSLLNRSLGLSTEDPTAQSVSASSSQQPQPQNHSESSVSHTPDHRHPTLIDSGLETLYDGFQKAKNGRSKTASVLPDGDDTIGHQENENRLKKLRLEDSKVRSLNANGRVDYSIQEGAFDISLIASIASHLTYWADEDVNHFMLSQMLSRKRTYQQE